MTGDIRQFVDNCPVCQMEKSDHQPAKGRLMSTQIPEEKWKEILHRFCDGSAIDPRPRRKDTILTIVDKATRMVHLVPCRKNITAVATAQLLWQHVVRLHGVPRAIYSDRGPQFTANSWQELWRPHRYKFEILFCLPPPNSGCGRANECSSESDTSMSDSRNE